MWLNCGERFGFRQIEGRRRRLGSVGLGGRRGRGTCAAGERWGHRLGAAARHTRVDLTASSLARSSITAPWRLNCSSWRAAAARRPTTGRNSTTSSKCELPVFPPPPLIQSKPLPLACSPGAAATGHRSSEGERKWSVAPEPVTAIKGVGRPVTPLMPHASRASSS